MSARPETDEEKQARQQAERVFVERAMAMIRETLYPRVSDSVFEREWPDLILAVSEPAAYLHARSLKLPGSRYLAILREVLGNVAQHGQAAITKRRLPYLPQYLRKCVQDHMQVKGESYLIEAKAAEGRITGKVAAVLRKIRPVGDDAEAARLTEALIAARNLVRPPARRSTTAQKRP